MKQSRPGAGLAKITYRFPLDAWHGYATETLWAQQAGEATYRLRSVPFYARGLSYDDIVVAQPEGDALVFSHVSLHGGHSTYRTFLADGVDVDSSAFREYWAPLAKLGCTFEQATNRLLAIDVSPNADIHLVYDLLQRGEDDGRWHFEEGHCGHG